MKKTLFIKNAAILTVSSLVLRFAGIIFKVWLAAKIGAEGIGLYQLVFSVYMFSATFATSGISTAVTRLISEELAVGNKSGIRRILKKCCGISLLIAVFSIAVLFFGGEVMANRLLHDARAALSLKILGFSLPFMGFCSCFKGYFIARRKAAPSSCSQLLEQAVRIVLVLCLVTKYNRLGLEYTCAIVLLGDTVAEAVSCIYLYTRYKFDFKKVKSINTYRKSLSLLSQITHIALPITAGRYLNSLLRMCENVLVPLFLSASGNGISLFGMIKGMALPILFFPSTLLNALSTLLIPEMSEAAIQGKFGVVRSVAYRIIKITSLVAIIFSALFFVGGRALGVLIYKDEGVGFLLCALSPIVLFMYLDAVCDGILKGLDQQKYTFWASICDSAIRIILIVLFLKRFGIYGFIGIMYFSNLLTGVLNTRRLLKVSQLKIDLVQIFLIPVCLSFSICFAIKTLLGLFLNPYGIVYIASLCAICGILYLALLWVMGIIDYDDIGFIRK
ncbi:MAG: oligosaccharide flippase family protein [Clostridia bacterium]|nr:oligosaccharide flippase family protein [Clostridia bacterium]